MIAVTVKVNGTATYCFDDIMLTAAEAQPATPLTIDAATSFQTLQGIGASDCWTAEYIATYFNATEKQKAAQWLFSQQYDAQGNPQGIGLSAWRVNLGAGSKGQGSQSNIGEEDRRADCYLTTDGTYDWTRCPGQQWFMSQAKNYGTESFTLFSNSAPVQFTKTGKANTNGQNLSCNLKDDCYDDFAEFLATTARHFADQGYNIAYVSPVNEPRFDWRDGQEGSPWENSNIAALAKQMDKSFRSRQLTAKILLPEASSWDMLYGGSGRATRQLYGFFDSASTTYIGNLTTLARTAAGHSYWTFTDNDNMKYVRQTASDEAEKYGVSLMQTEWSMLDAAPSTAAAFPASYEAATKMDIALYMAKVIHCDLCFANVTAWNYWTAFEQERYGQKNRFYLIRANAQGDTGDESYGDLKNGGTLTADKNLWVLGNYSRFIRPGYRRISISSTNANLNDNDNLNALLPSAWISPDQKEIVVVLVNMKRSMQRVSLSLPQSPTASVKAYITDKDRNLQLSAAVQSTENIGVPERAVVTVVVSLSSPLALHAPLTSVSRQPGNAVYDLAGRSLPSDACLTSSAPHKLYIHRGKKFFITKRH